jgi:hypothetical protein
MNQDAIRDARVENISHATFLEDSKRISFYWQGLPGKDSWPVCQHCFTDPSGSRTADDSDSSVTVVHVAVQLPPASECKSSGPRHYVWPTVDHASLTNCFVFPSVSTGAMQLVPGNHVSMFGLYLSQNLLFPSEVLGNRGCFNFAAARSDFQIYKNWIIWWGARTRTQRNI